jgi:hypothetical protein
MKLRRLLLTVCMMGLPLTVCAQDELDAGTIYLGAAQCRLRTGSGTPEGVVVGKVCDTYWRTDSGTIYTKISGTGNTGWVTNGVSGSGTAGTIAKWTATSTLGNSMITEASNNIVVTPTGKSVLPGFGYDTNLGSLTTKYLTLHAAELWVETLVAQNTLATIGGRVLVAPTNVLTLNAPITYPMLVSVTSGLAAYWPLSDTSGTSVFDTSGNGRNGTYHGGFTLKEVGPMVGDASTSTKFNGSTGYADVATHASLHPGDTFTLEAWFKRNSTGTSDTIINAGASDYQLWFFTDNKLYLSKKGIGNAFQSTSTFTDANWHYVVATKAGNTVHVYIDGSEITGTTANFTIVAGTGAIFIGSDDAVPNSPFDGWLSEVAVYSAVMTAQQVADKYAARNQVLTVKYNNLANGDLVYMEANGKVEFMAVISAVSGGGPFTYSVTRDLDRSGSNDWYAGDALLNTGQTGGGFLDIYSVRGVKAGTEIGPTLVGNVRNSSAYNDWSARYAVGNLNGLYGYGSNEMGAAFGVAGGARVTIDATNGIRMYDGSNTQRVSITPAGAATFSGDGSGVTNINGGNIQTDTITATQIAANAITTSELDALSVTTAKLDALAVTTAKLDAGAVTAAKIAAHTITANEIAASTITATEIAATTITAGKLNIGTLSAISADLGTITGGSISGVTITAGGGNVTLNSSGISLAAGTGTTNKIIWSNGSAIHGRAVGSPYNNTLTVGTGGDSVTMEGDVFLDSLGSSGTTSFYPTVVDGNNKMLRKENGFDGTCSSPTTIVIQKGIVTSCS